MELKNQMETTISSEIEKIFRYSGYYHDVMLVMADTLWTYQLSIVGSYGGGFYLLDSRLETNKATHYTHFVDVFRRALELYAERVKEGVK